MPDTPAAESVDTKRGAYARHHLPLQPFLDYVERHSGGLARLPGLGVRRIEASGRVGAGPSEYVVVDRTPEERRRYDNLVGRIARLRREGGSVPWYTADQLACEYLGVHPVVVWPDWYAVGESSGSTLASFAGRAS